MDSSPRILGGSLPGFSEPGVFRSCRGVGRASPDQCGDKIEGDAHAAIAVSDFPKQASSGVRPSRLDCGRRSLKKAGYRHETDEAAPHRDVAYVRRPDLIESPDPDPAQEIRINLVSGRRLARIWAPIDRFDPPPLHQRRHMLAAHGDAFAPQQIAQHPRARKGMIAMPFVEAAHQPSCLRNGEDRHMPAGKKLDPNIMA